MYAYLLIYDDDDDEINFMKIKSILFFKILFLFPVSLQDLTKFWLKKNGPEKKWK